MLWALFSLSHDVATSFILMGIIGVTSAAFGVLQTTLVLMTTGPELHGRALGVQELAIGIQPISSLALGFAATFLGIGTTTFISALLLLAAALTIGTAGPRLIHYPGVHLDG